MLDIAHLSAPACRVALRFIDLGGENESRDDTMAAIGLTSRGTFYRARRELVAAGFITPEGELVRSQYAALPLPAPTVIVPSKPEPEPESWAVAAMQADNLDDSGDITRKNSPAQARRRAQIEVLQRAYEATFGGNLTADNAKALLNAHDNYAEDVVSRFETVAAMPKKIEYPVPYILKIAKNARTEQRPDVRQADIGPDVGEVDFYLDKPTARTAELERKMAALGLFDDDEEDD